MKKLVLMLVSAIMLVVFTANTAAAQRHKFYYYPSANVYYDVSVGLYYYNPGSTWTSVQVLPPGFSITIGAPRYVVYHQGPDVWVDNHIHVVKYKGYNKKSYSKKYYKHKKHGKRH